MQHSPQEVVVLAVLMASSTASMEREYGTSIQAEQI
jgi:hypothetical protein